MKRIGYYGIWLGLLVWVGGCWIGLIFLEDLQAIHPSLLHMAIASPWPAFAAWPIVIIVLLLYAIRRVKIRQGKGSGRVRNTHKVNIGWYYEPSGTSESSRRQMILLEQTGDDVGTIVIPKESDELTYSETGIGYFLLLECLLFALPIGILSSQYNILAKHYQFGMSLLWCFGIIAPFILLFFSLTTGFGYEWLGFERLSMSMSDNRLRLYKEIVFGPPLWLTLSLRTHSAPLNSVQTVRESLKGLTGDWESSELFLILNGAKIAVASRYYRQDHQRIIQFLNSFRKPMHRYTSTHTVVFGDDGEKLPYHQGILRNPELSEDTLKMSALRSIHIYTASYDFHQVERFLTYAVNVLGQTVLKRDIEVHVYGDSAELQLNLYNALSTLCKSLEFHDVELASEQGTGNQLYFK